MNNFDLLLLLLVFDFFTFGASNDKFHYPNGASTMKNNRNARKKSKNECDCQCGPPKVIAVQQEVEVPRVQIVEESDESAKNFHEFKLYRLAKNFNGPIEQQEVDKKEIRRLLEKEGY